MAQSSSPARNISSSFTVKFSCRISGTRSGWALLHNAFKRNLLFSHACGNACRCTGYRMIVDAVMDAAKVLRSKNAGPLTVTR